MEEKGDIINCHGIQYHQCIDECPICKKEIALAKQLKLTCDERGREKDPQKSATILHQLGQTHQQRVQKSSSQDWGKEMFDLIRSIALYNAAIIRSPNNVQEIKMDLSNVCKLVLQKANAQNQIADLVEEAKAIKFKFNTMRHKTKNILDQIPMIPNNLNQISLRKKESNKIKEIKRLQDYISKEYTCIMASLAGNCREIMGKPPCKFTLVGMGSLARKEITPYSDFENIIVLEDASHDLDSHGDVWNYFRWFSVIFQTILINLGETIVPSVAIYSLNNNESPDGNWYFDEVTPRGISFDGMMPEACKFPIGKQEPTKNKPQKIELIKPVKAMLEYLTKEEELKVGYHLFDILTKVCYVYGEKAIFEEFQIGVRTFLECQDEFKNIKQITNQVNDDISRFATRSILQEPGGPINVKKHVYRCTTLFITALGRIHKLHASACFDIISELRHKNKISMYAEHKLNYAVALACEIRLRWYMHCRAQNDCIEPKTSKYDATNKLLELFGKSSLFSYFKIAYALQSDISKQLGLQRKYFFSNPQFLVISLLHYFGHTKKLCKQIEKHKNKFSLRDQFLGFDDCMKLLEKNYFETKQFDEPTKMEVFENPEDIKSLMKSYKLLGDQLLSLDLYSDAIEAYKRYAQYYEILKKYYMLKHTNKWMTSVKRLLPARDIETSCDYSLTLHKIGRCFFHMNNLNEALDYYKKAIDIQKEISLDINTDCTYAKHLTGIGECLVEMNKPKEALENYQLSLQIKEKTSSDVDTDCSYAITLHGIGRCYLKMNGPNKAMAFYKRSLHIKVKTSSNVKTDRSCSMTLHDVGQCLLEMNSFNEAMCYFKQSLEIHKGTSLNVDTDRDYAKILQEIGRCLLEMNNLNEAIGNYEKSLQIIEKTSLDLDTDCDYSKALTGIGQCLLNMNNPNEALNYYKRSLQVHGKESSNVSTDRIYSKILHKIGRCLLEMNNPNEAIDYLKRSLQIKENTSSDVDVKRECAIVLHEIGQCFLNMSNPDDAISCYKRSLQIKENITSDFDRSYAITLARIGQCLLEMNDPNAAKNYYKQSVEILEKDISKY